MELSREDFLEHLNIFIFKDFDKVILHRLKECLRIFSCYILSLYDDICCITIALREEFLSPLVLFKQIEDTLTKMGTSKTF